MSKINWLVARNEYVIDESLSYEDIAQKYGVSKSQVVRVADKEQWQELRAKAKQNATEMLPKKVGESIAEVNERHVQTAKILQTKGMVAIIGDEKNGIKPIPITSFDHARKAVDTGVTMERRALGLDKESGGPSVNVFVAVSTDQKKYGF